MDHVDFLDVGRFHWNKKIETASFCGHGYACQTMEKFFTKPWEEFIGSPVGLAVLKITYNDRLGYFKKKYLQMASIKLIFYLQIDITK